MHVAGASLSHLGPQPAACDNAVSSFFADKTVQSCVTVCQHADNRGAMTGFTVNLPGTKLRLHVNSSIVVVVVGKAPYLLGTKC